MSKMKLILDVEGIETTNLYDSDVHFRVILHDGFAKVACVQDFDYVDYAQFIGEICFIQKTDALEAAQMINSVGANHFI